MAKPILLQSTSTGLQYAETYVDGWPLHLRPHKRRVVLLAVCQRPQPVANVVKAVRQELRTPLPARTIAAEIAWLNQRGYLKVYQ